MASPNSDYDRALPRKRVAAGVLFVDDHDRVMLVDPVYKTPWEIPGGAVEADESPRAGAHREIKEELGLDLPPGRLLVVDWTPPRPDRSEGLVFIYDGGHLTAEQLATIQLQPEELRAYEFVPLHQIADRLIPLLASRIQHSAQARAHHTTLYLENGMPSA
ncbi:MULTISPECIES: NUDIX hydrolase [unclassified Streptomyces]|uniref:NUDIX domain-containing protein n=1 Tax=unclassified Streptomyces TaxID=2593676 RepID=UPI002365760D|nr:MULTISPECIES: NUDIX hydrolase [unclassified Streptomyces]MDF3141821.1 NUDIX hydrolase [Streptomyces sp. T21Q-yed]WDF45110.1 NUDIX hydrolase [Streptomyces sp. T12]